jgi:hypothetical protein
MDFIASTKLADFLSPKREGEPVNVHVVAPASEPCPDFDAMQKVIQGPGPNPKGAENRDHAHREVPQGD